MTNTEPQLTDTQLTAVRVPELPKVPDYSGTAEYTSSDETVNHPAHYGGQDDMYESIKVIQAWDLNFELGSVIKYVSRAGRKPGADYITDLQKAMKYLQFEIDKASR